MEKAGKPALILCNEGFADDARSAASSRGWPGIRILPETVPCECSVLEQVETGVDAAVDDIVKALTSPLNPEEAFPKKEPEKLSRITFKGDLAEVNRFFYRRGWTDGFPVIPPTEKAVTEMLAGTDLSPDHVVGELIPRLGKATLEKIAVNAVMAGALPTYMPVLVAGVQAIISHESSFGGWGVSTGSWAPFWIINGPIRRHLNINSGQGALSPGDIANATIGRAMGLIIKNIGGARKGIEDMGVMGNPMRYTAVIAENEEASPWEPLNVQEGYHEEQNTITVFSPNSYYQVIGYSTDDKGILSTIIYNLGPGRRDGDTCILLNEAHARILADKGWSKKDIITFITEHAYVPFTHHPYYWGSHVKPSTQKLMPVNPHDNILLVPEPNRLRIVVTGGAGNFMALVRGSSGGFVTQEIALPAAWEKLINQYKGMVPTHVRY